MTAILLRIEEGPRAGEEFRFDESDDVIVGSDRPGSEAQLRIPAEDPFVSRHHCVVEVRPPHCRVRDLGSKNGIAVRRSGAEDWHGVESADLDGGDALRVGRTVLRITLVEAAGEADSEPVLCIRCTKEIDPVLASGSFTYGAADYMCADCQAAVAAADPVKAAHEPPVVCSGEDCDKDVSGAADRDGRAAELEDVAIYLCDECAESRRDLMQSSIGGWKLLSQLGQGGMGVVYLVWHPETGRVAALKHLLKPLGLPAAKRLRFQREIALLQSLHHPQVTRIFEAGEEDGVPFFVSEFVPDGDLSRFVAENGDPRLTPVAATRVIADTLWGLAYIHDAGIVHRDMKPPNVLLKVENGSLLPKVADFGLSRSYERHGGTITQRGEVGGTLAYLAPEQAMNFKRSRPPVDVYSTGVCLYYLLTGRYPIGLPPPWQTGGLLAAMALPKPPIEMVLEDDRVPVRDQPADVPAALAEVVDAAVERNPKRRIQTAAEFRERLLYTLPVGS